MTEHPPNPVQVVKIYKTINAVQAELSKVGISKDQMNSFQKYKFRGIDDILNVLSPLLAKHGLLILPRVQSRTVAEHESKQGGITFYVTLEVDFDFVCVEDGSRHVVTTFGEAMDSSDKATNKAMSAAYKYAVIQAFAIPTEGDNDADLSTPQVTSRRPAPDPIRQPVRTLPATPVPPPGDDLSFLGEPPPPYENFPTEAPGPGKPVNPRDYVVKFGKWKDRRLGDLNPNEVRGYVTFLQDGAMAKNKPLDGPAKEFVQMVEALR